MDTNNMRTGKQLKYTNITVEEMGDLKCIHTAMKKQGGSAWFEAIGGYLYQLVETDEGTERRYTCLTTKEDGVYYIF